MADRGSGRGRQLVATCGVAGGQWRSGNGKWLVASEMWLLACGEWQGKGSTSQ